MKLFENITILISINTSLCKLFSSSSINMSSTCYFCLLLLMSLFHLCLSTKNLNHVLCKDVERKALLQFKHGLIDPADRLASWVGEEKECCSWAGIVCDNFTGHVHQIHLRGVDGHCNYYDFDYYFGILTREELYDEASKEMLGGELSPSLLDLKQLKHLDLSCNNFTGIKVPSFLGYLGNLRYLNISSSKFVGIIPPQLGNLSGLQVLCLGGYYDHNFESESISMMSMQWLSNLRLLHHLDMNGVDLNKAFDWLQVINTLPSLVELHLSNCQLLHIYPHVPRLNLTSLSLLDLSYNYFLSSSMPQWIFSLTSLVSLDLSSCHFHGHIPGSVDSFRNLTSLEFLHVGGNDFMNSSSVLKGLSSVGSNLVSLDIGSCGVTSSVLDALHNLTSLLSLHLSDNQLTKAIPKSLGNLCNLKEIDMSFNYFQNISLTFLLESFLECKSPRLESLSLLKSKLSGPIPYSIGGLSLLKALDLSGNLVSGPIPYSIGGLSSLKALGLSRNLVFGPIPYSIGQLSSLELLDLSYNRLNGSLPDSLGQLSMLHLLDFSYNLLNGVVTKAHFAKLASLIYLDGSGNSLTFRPQPANWVPPFQLQNLYVNGWDLGPQFPLWLQLQRDLENLHISSTNISAPIPQSFWRSFPNLVDLNMSQNHIQGTLFSIPATMEVMDLSSNKFRGQLPHLSNRPSIHSLDLSDNLFAGSLHHFLCHIDVISIKFLNLGNNNLSSVIPECWEKWRSLWYINLENNNLHGEIPKSLGFLSQLQALNMHGNKLTGRLPPSLMYLTELEILQLGGNELSGSIPEWFGRKLSVLRILNLRLNNFDENIPHELCYLSVIQILDLAHNNLSGNIPSCFNNFSVLTGEKAITGDPFMIDDYYKYTAFIVSDALVMKGREDTYNTILPLVMMLDLSNNNFSGHIPNELTTLKMLRSLNLSRNQLTGRIPENIGDMKSLESFDVSLNKLCGELPMSLSRLSFLSSFNVSYNGFTGRVPTSTQLQSFNESSFFGNKLCGDPLTDHCVVEVLGRDHHEEDDDGADWGLIISIVFGFVAGFWIIVGPLIISTSWRIAYFRSLTGLSYLVCDVMHKYRRNIFRM